MDKSQIVNLRCAALLLCAIAAFVVLKSARDALFLAGYSPRLLPYIMAATTLAGGAAAAVYLKLLKRFTLGSCVFVTFALFVSGTLVLWPAIVSGLPHATLVLYLWTGIFGTLAPVQCWSLITQQMLAREARRSLQIIGAGSIVGGTAGGFLANWTAMYASVPALLPLATILMAVALFLVNLISQRPPALSETSDSSVVQPRRRFVLAIVLFVASTTIIGSFADFQLKVIAQQHVKTAAGLASFFGNFYAYTGAATLLVQALLLVPMMRRFPLPGTLSMLPAALMAGNGILLVSGTLSAAVLLKGSEQLFRYSVDRSTMEVLYTAIPENAKIRIKSLADIVGVRGTELFAALLLILLFSVAKQPLSTLAVAGIGLSIISLAIVLVIRQEYERALLNAVHRDDLTFSDVRSDVFRTDFYNVLPDVLKGAGKETILDLLEILATNKKLTPHLAGLLQHPEPEIRFKSLQILLSRSDDFTIAVVPLLNDHDRKIQLEAIHYLLSRNMPQSLAAVARLNDMPDPEVRVNVYAAGLLDPGEQNQQDALHKLLAMLEDSPKNIRLELATVLGYLKAAPISEGLLRRLLWDADTGVQKAALISIGRTAPAGLAPDLINALETTPTLATEIRAALSGYGESLISELQKMLEDRHRSRDQKKLVLNVARNIGGDLASEMLMRTAHGSDLALRFAALKGLNALKRRGLLKVPPQDLESLLSQELDSLSLELQRAGFVLPRLDKLLWRVLRQRREWAQERIFRVLELLYDSTAIQNAYQAWRKGDAKLSDKAIEWLDSTLRPEHRKNILNFLDPPLQARIQEGHRARKPVLMGYIAAGDQLPAAALISDFSANELTEWSDEIQSSLKVFSGLTLVEETLNWKHGTMTGRAGHHLSTIQKLENLAQVDIFRELGPHEQLLLANQALEVQFHRDEFIIKEGDTADSIFWVVRGEAERTSHGRSLELLKTGESFGTLASLTGASHFYSVKALTSAQCLKLPLAGFREILEDYPVVAIGILRVVSEKFQGLLRRIEELESGRSQAL